MNYLYILPKKSTELIRFRFSPYIISLKLFI